LNDTGGRLCGASFIMILYLRPERWMYRPSFSLLIQAE
jgi:hypothetical protein